MIRPQLAELPRRVADGRANHDHVAARLNSSPWFDVPAPLPQEERAPDSIQFNLIGMSDAQVSAFVAAAAAAGVNVQVFGTSPDNARAFWNWQFIEGGLPDLPQTRAMLMRACDMRLPARLKKHELDFIADTLLASVSGVMTKARAYGT